MASRPTFKQQQSYGEPSDGQIYEMKPIGGEVTVEQIDDPDQDRLGGTAEDRKDMYRLNKAQELQRNFQFFSIFGYSLILGNGWVLSLVGAIIPLTNGGTAGAIWMYFVIIIGLCFCTLSMAEMASQYHWVSEFAPRKYQQLLSYITGWLCVLGWQTALCSTAYSCALAVQGMIALNTPGYTVPAWHGVLLTVGVVLATIVFNTVLLRKLPIFEGVMITIHVFGFIAILTVLWVMGDKAPAYESFTQFTDPSHWGSVGLATLVGSLGASGSLLGTDCAAHLAEELKDASWVLPRSMVVTAAANYSLTFIMVVTWVTVKGGTVNSLLNTNYAQSYVQIFYNVTQSTAGATALTFLVFILCVFGTINQVTTASRQLFAFARDRGLPFSDFLGRVRPGWDIPLNAVTVTLLFSIIVSMIILGSPVAFWTLGSMCNAALYASYLIVIGCVVWRRISGEPLPPSRFDLGKAGLPVNLIAMAFLSVQFVFIFFPTGPNPIPSYMNWTSLVFGVTVIMSLVWYFIHGKREYLGPVEYVRKSD